VTRKEQLYTSILVGLGYGLVFTAWILILAVLRGSSSITRFGVGVPVLIGLYIGGGLVGGTLVGLLLPLARRNSILAALVGWLAPFPFFVAFGLITASVDETAWESVGLAATASVIGAVLGVWIRRDYV